MLVKHHLSNTVERTALCENGQLSREHSTKEDRKVRAFFTPDKVLRVALNPAKVRRCARLGFIGTQSD